MDYNNKSGPRRKRLLQHFYQKSGLYIICVAVLFIGIGFLTTVSPAYRFSSNTITNWTSDLDSSIFLYLMRMENKGFEKAYPDDQEMPDISNMLFEMTTNIKPSDTRSLLGQELPGFLTFQNEIIVAGEGTDYTNLPVESAPPLDEILKEREAVVDEDENDEETDDDQEGPTTGDRDVVFIYNTHNRESFLPQLPDADNADEAQHDEVNVEKVSERIADELETNGIGTKVDHTDIMHKLNKQNMKFYESYQASREVVEEAFADNDDLKYSFDVHRDSMKRDKTTTEIDGKDYARIMFVVGTKYDDYDHNLEVANELHKKIEDTYPGLSRGVITKKGAGSNGVYNQDLSPNAMLMEIGGIENNLDELYRTADAVADIFSDYYWDAEKVDADKADK